MTAAAAIALVLCAAPVVAQHPPRKDSYLRSIEQCNRMAREALESRIAGCTVLIEAGYGTSTALAIAYNNRGNAYIAKGDLDRAIEDFDRSIRLDRNYAKPNNNRGVAHMKKAEYDLAIEAFDEAIRLDPGYSHAYANRAGAYLKKHDYARAAQDYDSALRLDPGLEAAWHGGCWSRAVLGELPAALEACNQALSRSKKATTYDSLGLVHLKMNEPAAAIDDYSTALRLDPTLTSALYGRGLARLRTGDTAGSDADIAAARALAAGLEEDFSRYGVR